MAIILNLSSEIEARLHEEATRQGRDIAAVATDLLVKVLDWEAQDLEAAIAGIQRGLDAFEAVQFRSFAEFAEEQRQKHRLPTN